MIIIIGGRPATEGALQSTLTYRIVLTSFRRIQQA